MEHEPARFEPRHSIGVVCRRANMKPDRVRAWERRYGVVDPCRSSGNQRLYSDADIERLVLLQQATGAGHRIAQLAALEDEELRQLLRADTGAPQPVKVPRVRQDDAVATLIRESLYAVQQLDRRLLRTTLSRAESRLDTATFLESVLGPLVQRIGDLWAEGGMAPAHEHMATSVIRVFVEGAGERTGIVPTGPTVLVTTPARQRHEIGALLALATAASEGWMVAYLGADLPAGEIASAARQLNASAVALSIVYPDDDPDLGPELMTLRRHLGADVDIIVGGRAASAYLDAFEQVGAIQVADLGDLRRVLKQLGAA